MGHYGTLCDVGLKGSIPIACHLCFNLNELQLSVCIFVEPFGRVVLVEVNW
jgi:hypothetical protein